MKRNTFTETLYKNAGYITVVLISLVYILSSLVLISKTGKSVYEIIGSGFLSLVVGMLINGAFRNIGIRRGDEDEKTLSTISLHQRAVEEIVDCIDRLDGYCERETVALLKRVRTRILADAGLKYEECFDSYGIARELILTDDKRKNRKIKRAYKKAVNIKIKPLTASSLTTDGGDYNNPYDFGKSKRAYTRGRSVTDVVSRLIMAIIFGYFGVSLVSQIDFATVIWNTLQIVMYITGGVIQMYTSYMWIVDDYRGSIIKKIDQLQKFKLYVKANPT